jgi:cytochrome c5
MKVRNMKYRMLAIAALTPLALAAPSTGYTDGKSDYETMCAACHGPGIAGAPKFGDAAAWKDRIGKDREEMYSNAINGYQGETGIMPPKGGFMNLSDDQVKAAVDHMLGAVQ